MTEKAPPARALITGGTGFVGQHLARFLKSRGFQVAILSSDISRAATAIAGDTQFYGADIRDRYAVQSIVSETSPSHIYHLAGISAVDISRKNPRLTYETNVFGAYNLFEAATKLPLPPKILNVSTSQIYAPCARPLKESDPIAPDNPYAASKAMAELLMVQYRNCASGGIITTRSFNHTGPGQNDNFVLPSMAKQFVEIEARRRPAKLLLGNIEVKRDFTDVRDVVRAYFALLDRGKTGDIYNVCSGVAVGLKEIISTFETVCGVRVAIETDPAKVRANEVNTICGDRGKIFAATGWHPEIPFRKTAEDLVSFWRSALAG